MDDDKETSSRLPRLKLNINGQRRSYSLTNLSCKKWFSEESLPSKLLKRGFQRSKIPEPRDFPQPVYRSLRSTGSNYRSSESLPQNEPDQLSISNEDNSSSLSIITMTKESEADEKYVVNWRKHSDFIGSEPHFGEPRKNIVIPVKPNRPPWKPVGLKTDRKSQATALMNGSVERIRHCCRLMKQSASERGEPKRKSTKENSYHQIIQLKKNIADQQEEILYLQEILQLQKNIQENGDEEAAVISSSHKFCDVAQPKVKGETMSSGYHSLSSDYGAIEKEPELAKENELLRMELQEAKDHSELLEFRILEFTEGIQGATVNINQSCDQATCTSTDSILYPHESHSVNREHLFLSPYTNYDSEMETNPKLRLKEYQNLLNQLNSSVRPDKRPLIGQLNDLLEWAAVLPSMHFKTLTPILPSDQTSISNWPIDEESLCSDLTVLASRLQESLANPTSQEPMIHDAIIKLRDFDSSVSKLHCHVNSLTSENKGLQEALAALHESHETRTEASGTESELVNAKTVQSDISDTESDEVHGHSRNYNSMIEGVNASTQTDGEDQMFCSRNPAEEQVILRKSDHDTIVKIHQKLQRDVDLLKLEKENLALTCSNLEAELRIANSDTCRDAAEVLRAEMRMLEDRLCSTERLKSQFFDEKCEMEEAENDARLMAQRFESQLDATREMEALLSASLSQEQEFSRELQRRVREMQAIDKGRQMHEERLEIENETLRHREANLIEQMESQTFAYYGLVLGDFWRRLASLNQGAVVPYVKTCHNSVSDICWNNYVSQWQNKMSPAIQKKTGYITNNKDSAVQTEPEAKIPRCSTEDEVISDGDIFYSALSYEVSLLNEETIDNTAETVKVFSEEEIKTLEGRLSESNEQLEESMKEKCDLLIKLQESQSMLTEIKSECMNHVTRLNNDLSLTIERSKKERMDIQQQYEDHIEELKRSSETHEQRFSALLQQYSILQQELAVYLDDNSSDNSGNTRITTTKDLLSAVRELARSEQLAKQRIKELEKKESAYRVTISEADRIMTSHVTAYATRIEEIETELEKKSLRVRQLEQSEETLRSALKPTWASEERSRIMELHDRLIETENSELQLKQRVLNLERSGKELEVKFIEAEKSQDNLKNKLRDQEELLQRHRSLASENNSLTFEIQKAHESAMRASDIRQNEIFLKSRMEELELSETSLKSSLKDRDQLIYQRDRKHRDQLTNLNEEISSLRNQLESKTTEAAQTKSTEINLKKQTEDLKRNILELENDLRDASIKMKCDESNHRSEVARQRLQLKVVNEQLAELDNINGELRTEINGFNLRVKEMADRSEERTRNHENDILTLNKLLEQKTLKLEEYEAEVPQLTYSNLMEEFNYLTSSLLQLQNCLQNFLQDSTNCEECTQNTNLKSLTRSLNYLIKLVNRNSITTDSDDDAEFDQKSLSFVKGSDDFDASKSTFSTTNNAEKVPSVPPRPRRDAKVKKRTNRNSLQNEGSIMQELEDTSLDLNLLHGYHQPSSKVIEELEENVRNCEAIIFQKDEHLQLADLETTDLHSRLIEEKAKLSNKIIETNQSNKALASLREELKATVNKNELIKQTIEEKHTINMRALQQKTELLLENLRKTSENSQSKDKIIQTFIEVLKSNLTKEALKRVAKEVKISATKVPQMDVDQVYQQLNEPTQGIGVKPWYELTAPADLLSSGQFKHQPHITSLTVRDFYRHLEQSDYLENKTFPRDKTDRKTSSENCTNDCSNSSNDCSHPPLTSRIPRFKSPPQPHVECQLEDSSNQIFSKSMHRLYTESAKYLNRNSVKQACSCTKEVFDGRGHKVDAKPSLHKGNSQKCPPRVPLRRITRSSSVGSIDKKSIISTGTSNLFNVPKPKNLRITRRVGTDGALIAWSPLGHENISGFQVIVGGLVVQVVRSPHRTKALVNGLCFDAPFTIALVTVTKDGRCSTPALICHKPEIKKEPKLRRSVSMPLTIIQRKPTTPACL